MKNLFIVTYLLLAFNSYGMAEEKALFDVQIESINNSDSVSQNSYELAYRNHRRDLNYAYADEIENSFDWGLRGNVTQGSNILYSFRKSVFEFSGAIKISKFNLLELVLGGGSLLQVNSAQSKIISTYRLNYDFTDTEKFSGRISIERNLYSDVLIPGDLSAQQLATVYSGNLEWTATNSLKFKVANRQLTLQDSNSKSIVEMSAMYGISTGNPWLWFGFGAERTAFSHVLPGYWSPSEFTAYGLRSEFAIELMPQWSFRGGVNLNSLHDKDTDSSGTGHYASAIVQKGDRNADNWSIGFVDIESVQKSARWREQHLLLTFNWFY